MVHIMDKLPYFLVTPTTSKGIVKSYPGRSKTPMSWRDQLDTSNVSQYPATQISGHSGYHVGPSLSAWYIIDKNVSRDLGIRRNSSLQTAWDTSTGRTLGFMWPHLEGNKIWQVGNSVGVQICGCGCVCDLFILVRRNIVKRIGLKILVESDHFKIWQLFSSWACV